MSTVTPAFKALEVVALDDDPVGAVGEGVWKAVNYDRTGRMPADDDLLPFTAHKFVLDDGRVTCENGDDPFIAPRTQALAVALGQRFAGRRILDLGSLEGGYTVAFALLGAEAVGIEARKLNLRRAEFLRDQLSAGGARFLRGDVNAIDADQLGRFDAVFASGILYHLDDPFTFVERVFELTTDVALFDTHVAVVETPNHGCGALVQRTHGGRVYAGREFHEYAEQASEEDVEELLWAAYGNASSFWLTTDSLVVLLRDAGFAYVHKVMTWPSYGCTWGCEGECRVLIVAKRDTPALAPRS